MGQFWEVAPDGSVKGYGIHENLLLNGGFEIDQANSGSVYTNPANGAFTLDSWQVLKTGSSLPTVNINRASRGDVGAQIDTGNSAMKILVSGAGSIDAQYAIYQSLPYQQFLGLTLSLSVRVYSSLSNAVRISIDDGVGEATSILHPGGGAYQTLSVTKTISTAATHLYIRAFRAFAPELQTGTFFIDSAMLVASTFAVPYRQRGTDYGIDGSLLVAASVKQDRVNLTSFSGSGIGFNQVGTIQTFFMAAPPSGWTQVVAHNDKSLRIVSGTGGGTGGSFAFSGGFNLSHSHTVNSHSHTVNSHSHSVSADGSHAHTVNSHTHGISADGSHNHGGADGSTSPGTNTLGSHQHAESLVLDQSGGTGAYQVNDTVYDARPQTGPWGTRAIAGGFANPITGHTYQAYTSQTTLGYNWSLTSPDGDHSHTVNAHTHSISTDGSHSHGAATAGTAPGTDTQGSHSHGAATGSTSPATDAQSPGTNSVLGTFTFQYIDIIVASKN